MEELGKASSGAMRSAAARELAPAARGGRPKESSEERASSFFRDDDGSTTSVDGPAGRGSRTSFTSSIKLSESKKALFRCQERTIWIITKLL